MVTENNSENKIRLGVNIDHIATIRNARGENYPQPVRAAQIAEKAGADGITVHLREDRRHIRDEDIHQLCDGITLPINLEMAATQDMLHIALKHTPNACCIVPERREELTTEGGLDVCKNIKTLTPFVNRLADKGIRVSLFIDPIKDQVRAAKKLNVPVVEFHTGAYCRAALKYNDFTHHEVKHELRRLKNMIQEAHQMGLEIHAGHGLTFDTVSPIAEINHIKELNIGHFIVSEAIFIGFEKAIQKMIRLISHARIKQSKI